MMPKSPNFSSSTSQLTTVNRDFGPCAGAVEEESIVTWAVRCLREQDPHSSTADVSVQGRGLIG